jgi:hypothetical protein
MDLRQGQHGDSPTPAGWWTFLRRVMELDLHSSCTASLAQRVPGWTQTWGSNPGSSREAEGSWVWKTHGRSHGQCTFTGMAQAPCPGLLSCSRLSCVAGS